MVLRKDETAAGQTHKYARVVKVHVGTDGKVRAADIEYKIPGEVRFCVTTRPIHKMVLVIPMEEQMTECSEEEMEATELEPQNQDREVSNGVQGEEEDKTPQVRGAAGTNLSSTKEPKRRPDQEAKHKETGPQRGARRQAQAVIITAPEGKEEIKDMGAAVKWRRGRPRKPKETNSPDPHKGSVPNYGEEVCVDPGKRDTTLGAGGPGPPGKSDEQQLVPDSG
jgi:hypothetical protein